MTPILSFVAFLLYAREYESLAVLVAIVAFVFYTAFPHEKQKGEQGSQFSWKSLFCIESVPFILIAIWLFQTPGYLDFVEQLFTQDLWDWHLITAVAIWHILWIKSAYSKALSVKDTEIVEIYSESNQ